MTMLPRQSGASQLTTLAIPTVEEISDAVARIPRAAYNQLGYSHGPRTYLTVSAGAVRVSVRDVAKTDSARVDARDRQTREIQAIVRADRAWLNEPMALTETPEEARQRFQQIAADGGIEPVVIQRRITSWSRRSRARMELRLRSLDYSPLFEDGRAPAMITLTMPGRYWEQCVPTPAEFKKKLLLFQQQYRRAWGSRPVGVWKMEFQRRGAPHLHVLLTPPHGRSFDSVPVGFAQWLSVTWARIVGVDKAEGEPRDGRTAEEDVAAAYADHIVAGTGIDYVEGEKYRDPKRMAQYFSKHGAYAGKEYQNEMPELWADAIAQGAAGAAFWGYWGLERAESTVQLACAVTGGPDGGQTYPALSAL